MNVTLNTNPCRCFLSQRTYLHIRLVFPPTSISIILPFIHPFISQGFNRQYSNGVRQRLARLYGQDPLFSMHQGSHGDYVKEVRQSLFCLCPRGFASWSRRLFDAIQLGCIPVIIAGTTNETICLTLPLVFFLRLFVSRFNVFRSSTVLLT